MNLSIGNYSEHTTQVANQETFCNHLRMKMNTRTALV